MTRAALTYNQRRAPARLFDGIDPEKPKSGFYRHRLRSGGVYVAVEVFHGPPVNPEFVPGGDEPE